MDQDILTELQDLVCILHGLNRLCSHIDCVHNYMARIKILYIFSNPALMLNHQSSQYIAENSLNYQNQSHTFIQEYKINQSLPRCIYVLAKLFIQQFHFPM